MTLFLAALTGLALGAAGAQPAEPADIRTAEARTAEAPTAEAPAHILTVITTPDPQTQLMALILARASIQAGAGGQVLLCGPAGDLALSEPPDTATAEQAPRGASPHGLLTGLIEQGVTVEVCAIYLPNSPHREEDLLEGVTVAAPPEIAAIMTAPHTRLFTF
ncbi:hypothetical protein ACWCOP_01520 [Maricaulaceae bacterium MS644]